MDLNCVAEVERPRSRAEIPRWTPDSAWVAGGSWLFSESQPTIRRLVDLTSLGWPDLRESKDGLEIAATCTLARLYDWSPPPFWPAASLVRACCNSLLASFKIWNVATIGGNMCLALPAAPFPALAAALDAVCLIWSPDGGDRRLEAADFVLGPRRTALAPGEILRSVIIPDEALRRQCALRKASLSPAGLPSALIIGASHSNGAFDLVISAATRSPIRLSFDLAPTAEALARSLRDRIPARSYLDDAQGTANWRGAIALHYAEEIRAELVERSPS